MFVESSIIEFRPFFFFHVVEVNQRTKVDPHQKVEGNCLKNDQLLNKTKCTFTIPVFPLALSTSI